MWPFRKKMRKEVQHRIESLWVELVSEAHDSLAITGTTREEAASKMGMTSKQYDETIRYGKLSLEFIALWEVGLGESLIIAPRRRDEWLCENHDRLLQIIEATVRAFPEFRSRLDRMLSGEEPAPPFVAKGEVTFMPNEFYTKA